MKKGLMFLIIFMILGTTVILGQAEEEVRTVEYGDQVKSVRVIWTDLTNEKIRVESVLAGGGLGQVDEMMTIYESSNDSDGQAIAAINGSFFSAYTDMQAQGTLYSDGRLKHIANTGSVFMVDKDNNFVTGDIYGKIVGGLNGQWEWPNNWYAWNINHWYDSSDAVMIFDKYYKGPMPEHEFTAIQVDKGYVIAIERGTFQIPDDGFLLLTKDQSMIDKFEIGIQAAYDIEYYENDVENSSYIGEKINFDSIRTMVGAGPTLVRDGQIVVDPVSEGFTESKINESQSTRSLIGVDGQGRLGMAVISEVSVFELAEIALNLGMVEALNLDGGASSGLIIGGQYVFEPGRDLSNIVVIKELNKAPIKIELNGRELFFDTEPYLNSEYNRTLVPLRGITEALGARVGWDAQTSSISIQRYDTELLLQVGSMDVMVNGSIRTMDIPVTIKDSRSYVPVRFVTEFLGGQVGWLQESQTVTLDMADVSDYLERAEAALNVGNNQLAITEYLKVLDEVPNHLQALKALGDIYTDMNDFENSVFYYEKYIALKSDDTIILGKLGWSYYNNQRFTDSIRIFEKYVDAAPDTYQGYYGLGANYAHYQVDEVSEAKKFYMKAIEFGLTGSGLDVANEYIESH